MESVTDSNSKKPKIEMEEEEFNNEKEDDENDCNDDDDDDDSSIGVPLIVSSPNNNNNNPTEKVEKPANGLEWDDDAIENCLNIALETHDYDSSSLTSTTPHQQHPQKEWQIPSLNQNNDNNWSPKSLPIPIWAVDPFY